MKVLAETEATGADGHAFLVQAIEGPPVVVTRRSRRSGIVNRVSTYERLGAEGARWLPLDRATAVAIVEKIGAGASFDDAFVVSDLGGVGLDWQTSEAEHRYTSTGIKWWRHPEHLLAYREGGPGPRRTVISTHVSPEGACNLKCSYCSVTYRDTHARIPLDRVQRYVDDLRTRGLRAVILTGGGEPTLYPDFDELVQWIKGTGLSVALITNGTTGDELAADTLRAFSWVRVSVNVFPGWQDRIRFPWARVSENCVVGCSFVHTGAVAGESTRDQVALLREISRVADRCGAQYIRVLPNCLLGDGALKDEHAALAPLLAAAEDPRFFHQYKVHRTPREDRCHQSFFRPYLSEEPWHGDGIPGTVYPCDSVVLNGAATVFERRFQLCKLEDVLRHVDGQVEPAFRPTEHCHGCVFSDNVETLGGWLRGEIDRRAEFQEPLTHEEFP